MVVYKVEKGARSLGLRRGWYVLVPQNDPLLGGRPGEIRIGRIRGKCWVQDGDPAWNFDTAPQGWGEYAYTHGGVVFRERCGLAAYLERHGYPQKVKYGKAVLAQVSAKEVQKVYDAVIATARF